MQSLLPETDSHGGRYVYDEAKEERTSSTTHTHN